MDIRFNSAVATQTYASLWNKYRPAILQLMLSAEAGPQEYKLFGHEFKSLNPKEKKGYAFTLQAYLGKATNDIRTYPAAQDLLYMLTSSKKGTELMSISKYEFVMDKHFNLKVSRIVVPVAEPEV